MLFKKQEPMELMTVTLQIVGMHCTSCALNIDFEMEDLDGVHESKTHYAKQKSEVKFDSKKVTYEQMIAVITKLGYEAIIPKQEKQNDK